MTAYAVGTAVGMAAWCVPHVAPWHVAVAMFTTLVTRHALRCGRDDDPSTHEPRDERLAARASAGRSSRRSAG